MSKTILITGATGNLGKSVCEVLHQSGYKILGTTQPGHQDSIDHAEIHEVDLSDETAAQGFIAGLKTGHASIDGVVCLAGGFGMGNVETASSEDLLSMFQLNFVTAYNIIRPAYSWMKETGGGQVIMTGAKPAVEGGAFEVLPYALSKGNIFHFSDILNEKSKDSGITSTVIVPSIIDTPPNRSAMPHANFEDWVTPSQIANQIAWLLSDNGAPLRKTTLKIYGNS